MVNITKIDVSKGPFYMRVYVGDVVNIINNKQNKNSLFLLHIYTKDKHRDRIKTLLKLGEIENG